LFLAEYLSCCEKDIDGKIKKKKSLEVFI
jgi:hypothetical protein